MPDENKTPSLGDIFSSSLEDQDVATDETTEDEVIEEGEDKSDTKVDKKDDKKAVDDTVTDIDEITKILSDQEKTNKRLEDTRQWGNKAHQNYLKSLTKLHELGEITTEEFEAAKKEGIADDQNDMQKHSAEFWTQYNSVKEFLADQGHNPDELVDAFQAICGRDDKILKEFMSLPANKKVKFVLEQGKEVLEFHQNLKKYGSYAATVTAIKQKAIDDYTKANPAPNKKDESGNNSVKPRPRLTAGGAETETDAIQQKSLSQLMNGE